jgi:hypothetical protein
MKKLLLTCFALLIFKAAFNQCEVIKTNLSTYIKSSLLAPTSFKIHRYTCEQISPPVQKLQSDLKKQKSNFYDQSKTIISHRDSLEVVNIYISNECDSLRKKFMNSPYFIEKTKLETDLKELKVNVPRDQEFIFWLADRGQDTTKVSLAFKYSNRLKNLHSDTTASLYNYCLDRSSLIAFSLEKDNRHLLVLEKQIGLIDLYLEQTKEFPVYKTYIVYQALTKGGSNSLFEENYYFIKGYKCTGKDYSEFWNNMSIINM